MKAMVYKVNELDRFGERVRTHIVDKEHFAVTVEVSVSPTFFAWVFTFGGTMTIFIKEFHGDEACTDAYLFYSRNKGIYGKLTQPAIDKMLKKYANQANCICPDVPSGLHAHQFIHAKASHWLEDGMNIVQISFLLGHEQLQTTMVYLDISTEEKAKALATLDDENDKKSLRNSKIRMVLW
jgi:hypothetical protein